LPGGVRTRWKTAPFHGAQHSKTRRHLLRHPSSEATNLGLTITAAQGFGAVMTAPDRSLGQSCRIAVPRSRSALLITEAELRLMASAAIIADSSQPVNGNNTPAASGTPRAL